MPDVIPPANDTTPDNATLPADWEVYKPDPSKPMMDILQLDLAPKLAAGTASKAERDFYNREKPPHWASWPEPADQNPEPAKDKPAAQQQQTPAQTPAAFTPSFDPLALAATSDADSAKFIDSIAALEDELEKFARATFDQERSRLRAADVADADGAAMQLAEKQRAERRAQVYAEQEPKLLKAIQALQQREQEITKVAAVYDCIDQANAATFATIESIGSDDRSKYAAQVTGLGAASLRALAELARSTNNLPLAAAVFAQNQTIEKSQRLFSNDQFAQKLWGDKARELHQAVVVSRQATNAALSYLRSLKSGVKDSLGKINRGVAREMAKYKPNPTEPPETPLDNLGAEHSVSRIKRGLRALAKDGDAA